MEVHEKVVRIFYAQIKAIVWAICTVLSLLSLVVYLFWLTFGAPVRSPLVSAIVLIVLILVAMTVTTLFPKSI